MKIQKVCFLVFILLFLQYNEAIITPEMITKIYYTYYHQHFDYDTGYSCIKTLIFILHLLTKANLSQAEKKLMSLRNALASQENIKKYDEHQYTYNENNIKFENQGDIQEIIFRLFSAQLLSSDSEKDNLFYIFIVTYVSHPSFHFF